MKKLLRLIKRLAIVGVIGAIAVFLFAKAVNSHLVNSTANQIVNSVSEAKPAYTGIVLGSLVFSEERISKTVAFRCDKAIELYKAGKIKRILLSGDHGTKEYDEVNAMKNYLIKNGIPERDIFLDHAGFNTYDTMIRAKKVFEVDNAIIISQGFHLARAVYIANHAGLDVQAIAAPDSPFLNKKYIENREILARVKSFAEVAINRDPKFLGDVIPITGTSVASFD